MAAKMKDRVGLNVYGFNDTRIGYHLKKVIEQKDKPITISTAESITGGLIGSMITDIDGSSAYYAGGVVAYSNDAKTRILQVDEDLIAKKGAVSNGVCVQMAKSSMKIFGSSYGVAVTGYAGPEGEEVGLVYCAIYGPEDKHSVSERKFIGTREDIKFRTAQYALNQLRIRVLEDE
ncbi:MAG: nicotinamide-nucleotide amidohydrolase family protein [Actinomycetota bacterium]|nr:nicotinamide-nucleotide amidohydrolase family protein [Actinomycetota bacterium]